MKDPLGLLKEEQTDPLGLLKQPNLPQENKETGYFSEMVSNIPKSAMDYAKTLVAPIIHPVETASNIGKIAAGLVEKISGKPMGEGHEQYIDAVGQNLLDRYGNWDNIRATIQKDPVGVLGDVSTILTGGGGLLRGAGSLSKVGGLTKAGEIAGKAGAMTNPLSIPGYAATGLRRGAEATGLGESLYEKALKIPPGSVRQEVRENIVKTMREREGIPLSKKALPRINDIVEEIDNAINVELRQLTSRMNNVSQIPVDDITKALDKLKAKYRNRPNSQEIYDIIDNVKDEYVNHAFVKGNINAQLKTASGQTKNYTMKGMIDIDEANQLKKGIYQEIQDYYSKREGPETKRAGIQNKIEAGAHAEAARIIRSAIIEHPDVPKSVKENLTREANLMQARKWVERAVNRGSNIDLGTLSTGVFGMLMGAGLKAAIAYRVAISQPIQTRVAIGLAKGSHIAKFTGALAKPISLGTYQAGQMERSIEGVE